VATEFFGVSPSLVRRWIADGKLTEYRNPIEGSCALPGVKWLPPHARLWTYTPHWSMFGKAYSCDELGRRVEAEIVGTSREVI
jgi:hypothetical protein